jgi:hypothetical protein
MLEGFGAGEVKRKTLIRVLADMFTRLAQPSDGILSRKLLDWRILDKSGPRVAKV